MRFYGVVSPVCCCVNEPEKPEDLGTSATYDMIEAEDRLFNSLVEDERRLIFQQAGKGNRGLNMTGTPAFRLLDPAQKVLRRRGFFQAFHEPHRLKEARSKPLLRALLGSLAGPCGPFASKIVGLPHPVLGHRALRRGVC